MKLLIWTIVILSVVTFVTSSRKRSRSTTTSSTTEASVVDLEQTLADREASLLDREESFRTREAVFRMREEKLSLREEQFKDREDKLSSREKNIALREQNTLRGSCKNNADGVNPPPDYSVVRLDQDTDKLADIGDLGTCSENMRFFANPDNETLGQCDCDYHQCARPLIFSDKYKQCFWAWSQGPCEQKEWFTFDENYMPICEPNPCPETVGLSTPSYYFKSPEDDKCYKAGSKGPCTKKGERLFTVPDDPIPRCRSQSLCPAQSIPAVQRCLPGNRRFLSGLCIEETSNDEVPEEV